MLFVSPQIQIPLSEIKFSYARSSGPGGQNVNKVNSKAILHWDLARSPSISSDLRAQIAMRLRNWINQDGELVISSDRLRDQIRNREDCLDKLRQLLESAAAKPTIRKATKPTRSSQRKTKDTKTKNSQKKALRRSARSWYN